MWYFLLPKMSWPFILAGQMKQKFLFHWNLELFKMLGKRVSNKKTPALNKPNKFSRENLFATWQKQNKNLCGKNPPPWEPHGFLHVQGLFQPIFLSGLQTSIFSMGTWGPWAVNASEVRLKPTWDVNKTRRKSWDKRPTSTGEFAGLPKAATVQPEGDRWRKPIFF